MNRTWLGVGFVLLLALALVFALSQGGDDTPATTAAAAPTTAPPTTSPPPTTVPPTTTSAPTTAPTTTVDLNAREAEVEALVTDLEFAFWQSLYRGDEAGLAEVVGGEALWDAVRPSLDSAQDSFVSEPTRESYRLDLVEILRDEPGCLVARAIEDTTSFLPGEESDLIAVLWPAEDAAAGYRIADHFGPVPESEWMPWCTVEDRSWRP